MGQLLPVFCFAGYVLSGLFVVWCSHRLPHVAGRRAVNVFLLYTLAVSFGAGLLQRDWWPFSNWPLVAGIQGPVARHQRLVAVDRVGQEHDVDYRAWQPFVYEELLAWGAGRLLTLGPAERDRAGEHLVGLAEQGRRQAQRGRVGYFDRTFGPFAAPYFLLHPKLWSPPGAAPSEPLVGVRLYTESWNLDERAETPSAVHRTLEYEYLRR